MKLLTRLLLLVSLSYVLHLHPTSASAETPRALPHGRYVLVAVRRASFVESTPDTDSNAFRPGDTVDFGDTLSWLDGVICNDWHMTEVADEAIRLDDPNLSDLAIGSAEPSAETRGQPRTLRVQCDGGRLVDIVQIDARVLVVSSPAGALNAILEKPLQTGQVRGLQEKLSDLTYYTGAITGVMDAATRTALARYAEFRGAGYVFHRAALTENLLAGLSVPGVP